MDCPRPSRAALAVSIAVVLLFSISCKDRGGGGSATSKPVPGSETPPASANGPRALGADADDDKRAPDYLPKSNEKGTWIKREAVRVVEPADFLKIMPAADVERLKHFWIRTASTTIYEFPRGSATFAPVRVLSLDTQSPEDAYGILTCQSSSRETYRIGGETRVERDGGLVLHCWQGKSYICVKAEKSDNETTEDTIRLLMHICGRIGREDPPALLEAFPRDGGQPRQSWVVHHLGSIPAGAFDAGGPFDAGRISDLLGLGRPTLMTIGSYDVPQGRRANLVWVVRYGNVKAAADAYARYSRTISKSENPVDRSTNLVPPQGNYLIGTWTAEEESLSYVLPRIQKLLPS